jgi:hypothetical protein
MCVGLSELGLRRPDTHGTTHVGGSARASRARRCSSLTFYAIFLNLGCFLVEPSAL